LLFLQPLVIWGFKKSGTPSTQVRIARPRSATPTRTCDGGSQSTSPRHLSSRSRAPRTLAIDNVVGHIDVAFPVMVSTNHEWTYGHIILVIGYEEYAPESCSSVRFICHDPYGKFNPQLHSKDYGKRRLQGAMSFWSGGEVGPGKAVSYDYQGIRRSRFDKHSAGTYFMISAAI